MVGGGTKPAGGGCGIGMFACGVYGGGCPLSILLLENESQSLKNTN